MLFKTKIYDSIKNFVHYGKNQPLPEVGGGFFCKNIMMPACLWQLNLYI